jgi:alpha-galactosidase
MLDNATTPKAKNRGHFTSEMFGVLGDRRHRTAILVGFLSQVQQFGSLEAWLDPLHPSLRVWAQGDGVLLEPEAELFTDWACLQFMHIDSTSPMGPYLDAVSRENGVDDLPEVPVGWCSWYHYFEDITAQDLRRNLTTASDLRPDILLDLIQIDDGYMTSIGDWDSFNSSFPDGVALLADEIQAAGFTPGLWMAPFLLDRDSRIFQDRSEWVLRNRWGWPSNAGLKGNRFAAALDLTHPDALAYVQEKNHKAAKRWGFPYLKLDFLYAAALPGRRHDPGRTRAQVLRTGLEAIRAAAGQGAFLLGCGCPLGPAIGLVDAMRISPDVERHWYPRYPGLTPFVRNQADFPAARNAVRNSLTRAPLHRRWWLNDPDCLLLNPDNDLSLAEVHSLATVIALTGGATLISDPLPELPPERLRILEALLPVIGKRPHVIDWFDRRTPTRLRLDLDGPTGPWHLIARFNWDDRPRKIPLRLNDYHLNPQAEYHARSFWDGRLYRIAAGELDLDPIPPHGVVLMALRRRKPGLPQYLGGNLHVSQGLEVRRWAPEATKVTLELRRPGRAQGEVSIVLPGSSVEAELTGHPIKPEADGEGRHRFALAFERRANLTIHWSKV